MCPIKTLGKIDLCRVPTVRHSAKNYFAVCFFVALGKSSICRVPYFCRVFLSWHTTKAPFAVCPIFCTQQTLRHTANMYFPVVVYGRITTAIQIQTWSPVEDNCIFSTQLSPKISLFPHIPLIVIFNGVLCVGRFIKAFLAREIVTQSQTYYSKPVEWIT